jgi:hypothetical protein
MIYGTIGVLSPNKKITINDKDVQDISGPGVTHVAFSLSKD